MATAKQKEILRLMLLGHEAACAYPERTPRVYSLGPLAQPLREATLSKMRDLGLLQLGVKEYYTTYRLTFRGRDLANQLFQATSETK